MNCQLISPAAQDRAEKIHGRHYDIVVNGVELGGSSIRIHQPALQKTIFEELLAIPPDETQLRFGYMLNRVASRKQIPISDRQRLDGMAKADRQRRITDPTMRHSADQFLHL